ncbi:hypothetical protein AAZX31_12G094000 [Glycine max]
MVKMKTSHVILIEPRQYLILHFFPSSSQSQILPDTYLLFLLVTSVCKARRLFFVYCVIVIPLARCSSS